MKELLVYIEEKKRIFSTLPLFFYMRDVFIPPLQRLAFAPCAAPFILSFAELNRYVFRDETSTNAIQKIVNERTYEDDHHWVWFLEDLEKLGLNPVCDFRSTLKMLWDDSTLSGRQAIHELYRYTHNCDPVQRLVAVEVIEATGQVMLAHSSQVTQQLEAETQQEYRYFGHGHLLIDADHSFGLSELPECLASLQLDAEQTAALRQVIDHLFDACTVFVSDLLAYAQAHPVEAVATPRQLVYQ